MKKSSKHAAFPLYHPTFLCTSLYDRSQHGAPYVIDFGKARLAEDADKTNLNAPDFSGSDRALLESARMKAKQWLQDKKPRREIQS